jgi:hypothetical protein
MQIDLGLFSTHFGNTNAGSDFKDFLGDEEYENHIITLFDDFLHESFSKRRNPVDNHNCARLTNLLTGPEVCNSRVCGLLDSKENSPASGGDEKDERDSSRAVSRHSVTNNSAQKEKQKKIVSAILSQFNG